MMDMRWWVGGLMVGALAGCAAAEDGAQDEGAQNEAGTESDPDDPIHAVVRCDERAEHEVSGEERSINATADAAVGLDLLAILGENEDNVLLSPMSLRSAFGQMYAGTDGASREEMGAVLHLEDLGDRVHAVVGGLEHELQSRTVAEDSYQPGLDFRPANRSFFDIPFEDEVSPDWLAIAHQDYGVCVEFFDLNADHAATLAHINGWVADQTADLIPELVKFLPGHVSLVVVNALYFHASWATPFEPEATELRSFTTFGGATKDVPTMWAPVLHGRYGEGDGWVAVALPYTDDRLEMIVILPEPETSATFEAGLDDTTLDAVFAALEPSGFELRLPKFQIRSEWELKEPLQALGMQAPFSNGSDFEGIASGLGPIALVFHDVAITIDEKGTEAAAATAVVLDEGGEEPVAEHVVVVDHTFYVVIRDRQAQSVMFFARIGDPSSAS
jgi:serpin B